MSTTAGSCFAFCKGDILTICGCQYEIRRDPRHQLPRRLRGRTDPMLILKDRTPPPTNTEGMK